MSLLAPICSRYYYKELDSAVIAGGMCYCFVNWFCKLFCALTRILFRKLFPTSRTNASNPLMYLLLFIRYFFLVPKKIAFLSEFNKTVPRDRIISSINRNDEKMEELIRGLWATFSIMGNKITVSVFEKKRNALGSAREGCRWDQTSRVSLVSGHVIAASCHYFTIRPQEETLGRVDKKRTTGLR